MNRAMSIAWFIVKPANKLHVCVYLFMLMLAVYNQLTLPSTKKMEDYKRVEGVFIKTHYWRGNLSFWLELSNKQVVKLRTLPGINIKKHREMLSERVVAYYWPGSFFAPNKILVYMSLLNVEGHFLNGNVKVENYFFRPEVYRSNNLMIFRFFFMVWFIPFIVRVLKKYRK